MCDSHIIDVRLIIRKEIMTSSVPAKRGRKPLFSDSMTPAQRKARQRREQDRLILENDSEVWTESDCMRVLSTKKFNAMHKFAWEQLGRLREYM